MTQRHTSTPLDLLIIGAGPGGYVAALRAAQLGLKVGLVDKDQGGLGGTCLNVGCIPSKALLHASHLLHSMTQEAPDWGITLPQAPIVDISMLQEKKNRHVRTLGEGIDFLLKRRGVKFFPGKATFVDAHTVHITQGDTLTPVSARHFIIATGSSPTPFPGVPFDEDLVLSSTGGLNLTAPPPRLLILGGGYIGVEMASIWARLGSQVTLLEYGPRLVPAMDGSLSEGLLTILKNLGVEVHLNTRVTAITPNIFPKAVTIVTEDETYTGDKVLVAMGRQPHTQGLGLEALGLQLTEKGFIQVSHTLQTAQPHIWAIGDVVGGMMLAHKAEHEGIMVVEGIHSGHFHALNPATVPAVIFTTPELASVGATEEELQRTGVAYTTGTFPLTANSRARAVGATQGFVKMLVTQDTHRVLGVHILGAEAGSMISEATLALEYSASAQDIAATCHPHPTYSEALKEAALSCLGRALHV